MANESTRSKGIFDRWRGSRGAGSSGARAAATLDGRLFEALPDAALVCDLDGEIVAANTAASELAQTLSPSLVGHSITELAGPYAGDVEGLRLRDAVRRGHGVLRLALVSAAGLSTPCIARISQLSDAERLVLVENRSDAERLEAELRVKSELATRGRVLLEAVADALDDGLVVLDDAERVVLVNRRAEAIFRLSRQLVHGRTMADVGLPNGIRGTWLSLLGSRERQASETLRIGEGEGARTVVFRIARAVDDADVPLGSVLVARDITGIARPERLRQDLLVSLTHALRTPLMAVQGFCETLLREEQLSSEERRQFQEVTYQESRRVGRVVERLLALMGADPAGLAIDKKVQDLRDVLRDAVDRALALVEVDGEGVRLDLPAAALEGRVDAASLGDAVTQLVLNAVLHGASPRGARVRLREQGRLATIEIRDWGPGVPPEELERIFDPFYRVRDSGDPLSDDLGLGLPFCRRAVAAHEGEILAELPRGGGLRVTIRIPV